MRWPSESLRVQAHHLKKKHNWTDEQCYTHFVKIGKITQTSAPPKAISPPQPPPGLSLPGVSLPPDLLKIVQYTATAQSICENWRAADTLAYLKESKQIVSLTQEAEQSAQQLSTDQLLTLIKPDRSLLDGPSLSTTTSRPSACPTSSAPDK